MKQITVKQYVQMRYELIIEFLKTVGATERHQLVLEWNFRCNGGTDVFQWIANDPGTDKATALMLYWKSMPWYIKSIADREEAGCDVAEFELVEGIEKLYLSDFYTIHQFAFDPTSSNGKNGVDWTEQNPFKLKMMEQRKIPAVMFESLKGEIVPCSTNFDEGIPPHIGEKLNEFDVVE